MNICITSFVIMALSYRALFWLALAIENIDLFTKQKINSSDFNL